MNMIFDIVVYLVFLAICIYGMRGGRCTDRKELLKRLNSMRGLFALEILIGHVVWEESTLLAPFGHFMMISVSFFFFVSGFGMIVSLREKENYFKGFIASKPVYIFIVAVFFYVFNIVIDMLHPTDFGYLVEGKSVINTFLERTNWYMLELIVVYIVFYISHKYFKKYQLLLCTMILLVLMHVSGGVGFPEKWYISTLAFPLGIMFGKYYDRVIKFMFSKFGIVSIMILAVLGIGGMLFASQSMMGVMYSKNLINIAGIIVVVYVLSFLNIGNNKVGKLLTTYSLEIYLSQFVFLKIFSSLDYKLRMIVVVLCCVVTSVVLRPVLNWIRGRLVVRK